MDNTKILLNAAIDESSLTDIQKQLLKKKFKIDVEVEDTSKLKELGDTLDYIAKKAATFATLKKVTDDVLNLDKSQFCPLWR